jgi:hypothetical protein
MPTFTYSQPGRFDVESLGPDNFLKWLLGTPANYTVLTSSETEWTVRGTPLAGPFDG